MNVKTSIVPKPSISAIDRKTYARMNALVVEDAAHMSSLICGILKSIGIGRLFEARNGTDALDILATQAIDLLLITDLAPPLDGLNVVRQVRTAKLETTRNVPIVYITAKLQKTNIIAARDAGATEILSKPFSATQMITRIEQMFIKPRPLVKSEDFVGPDRRRREKSAVERRRASDNSAKREPANIS